MLMCVSDSPANARRSANVGLMLGQRLRRWPNIKSTLGDLPARTDRLGRDRVQVCADKHGQSTYISHTAKTTTTGITLRALLRLTLYLLVMYMHRLTYFD